MVIGIARKGQLPAKGVTDGSYFPELTAEMENCIEVCPDCLIQRERVFSVPAEINNTGCKSCLCCDKSQSQLLFLFPP